MQTEPPPTPRLGAHLSIAGGLPRAPELATRLRATALQVFVKSARQWSARDLEPAEALEFREAIEKRDLAAHTLAHASYLINLASPATQVAERSAAALADELERCDRLGIPYLVVHPGSHLGSGEADALRRVARAIDRLFLSRGRRPRFGRVKLLLETTAGQGSCIGHRFEHLAAILETSRASERLGVCIDTCHVFAAGYDLRDAGVPNQKSVTHQAGPRRRWRCCSSSKYSRHSVVAPPSHRRRLLDDLGNGLLVRDTGYARTMDELDRTVGLERVLAFHLNDSRAGLGSRVDRHEHIGRGQLGVEPFRRLLNDPRFHGRPMVLETPKSERSLFHDRRNLRVLRELVS